VPFAHRVVNNRRTFTTDAGSNFTLKIAAKLLEIVTWLQPIEAHHHPIQRNHRRPLTTYHLATVHALQTTDDRQTD